MAFPWSDSILDDNPNDTSFEDIMKPFSSALLTDFSSFPASNFSDTDNASNSQFDSEQDQFSEFTSGVSQVQTATNATFTSPQPSYSRPQETLDMNKSPFGAFKGFTYSNQPVQSQFDQKPIFNSFHHQLQTTPPNPNALSPQPTNLFYPPEKQQIMNSAQYLPFYQMNPSAYNPNLRNPISACANPFFEKLNLPAMDPFKPRSANRKVPQWISTSPIAARTDQIFHDICLNKHVTLNPVKLGFIPSGFWTNKEHSFSDLVYDFFQRKNSPNCRFLHKLYNALKISSVSDMYAELTGVQWVTSNVIKVSKGQFARLLGIKAVDGSLFHQQGNFPTHGFVELNRDQVQLLCPMLDISTIDFDEIRMVIHQLGLFTSNSNEMHVHLGTQRKH